MRYLTVRFIQPHPLFFDRFFSDADGESDDAVRVDGSPRLEGKVHVIHVDKHVVVNAEDGERSHNRVSGGGGSVVGASACVCVCVCVCVSVRACVLQ
jgi:hypothetical protein